MALENTKGNCANHLKQLASIAHICLKPTFRKKQKKYMPSSESFKLPPGAYYVNVTLIAWYRQDC